MTDNTKKIMDRLKEAEDNQRRKRKVIRAGIDTCLKLQKEYEEELKTETDPDRFNEIVTKSAENENRLTAFKRQYGQKEAPTLSRQEFEAIRKDIANEFVEIQKAHAPAIIDALKKLLPLVNAYAVEVEELEAVTNGARNLTGVIGFNFPLNPGAIENQAPEDFADVLGAFMYGYCVNQATFRKYTGA